MSPKNFTIDILRIALYFLLMQLKEANQIKENRKNNKERKFK